MTTHGQDRHGSRRTCQRDVVSLGVLLANLVDGLDVLVVDLDLLEV